MGCAPVSALIGCCALVPSTTIGGYSAGRGLLFLSVGPWRACQARRWGRCNAPATCHSVTWGEDMATYEEIRARICTRSSIPRPGVGRASRRAISPMPRNCSACPRSPVTHCVPANIPARRKSCRSSGRPSSPWACCRRKTTSKLRQQPFPSFYHCRSLFPPHARATVPFKTYPPACGMAVCGPDLSARCGHQPPADAGQPVGGA